MVNDIQMVRKLCFGYKIVVEQLGKMYQFDRTSARRVCSQKLLGPNVKSDTFSNVHNYKKIISRQLLEAASDSGVVK